MSKGPRVFVFPGNVPIKKSLGIVSDIIDENMPQEVIDDFCENMCPITGEYFPDDDGDM